MGTPAIMSKWRSLEAELLSVLRIVCAFMFMQAGTVILFSWPAAMPGGAPLALASQLGLGGILEFVGGLGHAVGARVWFGFRMPPAHSCVRCVAA
jgi:putative oxidoreductase